MNLINIDGRHIVEAVRNEKFDSRMRIAFFAVAFLVVAFCAKTYDSHLRLPEKAVCADTVQADKPEAKFSAYYVECKR